MATMEEFFKFLNEFSQLLAEIRLVDSQVFSEEAFNPKELCSEFWTLLEPKDVICQMKDSTQFIENLCVVCLNDVNKAVEIYRDLSATQFEKILAPVNSELGFQGLVNESGCSCYVNSLIFAMFAKCEVWDELLLRKTDDLLNEILLLIVHRLRMGRLVDDFLVRMLRLRFVQRGWLTLETFKRQQDASEFFEYLINALDAPFLNVRETFFHGGAENQEDVKKLQERAISLSFSESSETVEQLLEDYFFTNRVSAVSRRTESWKSVKVDGWKMYQLEPTENSTETTIVPIVLKRYGNNNQRLNSSIVIPFLLDFTRYVKADDSKDYYLQMISAVCHIGSEVHSGHYISYVNDDGGWLRFDDLDTRFRVSHLGSVNEVVELFHNDISHNAYLIFYELKCRSKTVGDSNNSLLSDAHLAMDLQNEIWKEYDSENKKTEKRRIKALDHCRTS